MPPRPTRLLEQLDARCLLSAGAVPQAGPTPADYKPPEIVYVNEGNDLVETTSSYAGGTTVTRYFFTANGSANGSSLPFILSNSADLNVNFSSGSVSADTVKSTTSDPPSSPARPPAAPADRMTVNPGDWMKPMPGAVPAPVESERSPARESAAQQVTPALPSPQAADPPAPLARPSTPVDTPDIPTARRPAAENPDRRTGQACSRTPVVSTFWAVAYLPSPAAHRDTSADGGDESSPELPTAHAGIQAQFEAGETSPVLPAETDHLDRSDDWSLTIRWAVALSACGLTARRLRGQRATRPDPISLTGRDTNDV